MQDLQTRAREMFAAGVAAADPAAAVARHLPQALADAPGPGGRWHLIALGKAAPAMAAAALAALPAGSPALVVTTRESARTVAGAVVLAAGHPVPDAAGEAAARAVEAALAATLPQDRVLALISGGGSALLPAPVAGVSLPDKATVNRLLLGSGADIGQMNLVRQALSRLKGGGWLRASAAPISALILSDVPGDDLRVIASGPTVAPLGNRADAAAQCHALAIWDSLPASVRAHLSTPEGGLPPLPAAHNILIGSNALSLAAMQAAGAGLAPFALAGDVGAVAAQIATTLAAMAPGQVLVAGGETTVRLVGHGLGGRNQELALRVALAVEAAGLAGTWAFLAGGSDGRDGPTDAAGAVVGPGTLAAMRAAGIDPLARLADNDSYPALASAGALLVTGATGTNVADLAVLLRG
ncbi:MAG: hydroxypyruvate reductase [Alphaproteobacteria bacterium HGW-Alphaproteobacteria-4]|nr:MAG: hydroxypyruvate reductase [Alphaproteobacteria bacterium HGW-Alphaproteobacteria-4]